jgi:hypothetical protein
MLDVEGIVCDWLNTRTDLVGPTRPLNAGAHLKRIRHQGCYAYVIAVGTPADLVHDVPIGKARISVTVYGMTKEVAARGAIAYGSILERIALGVTEKMGDYKCIAVDNIIGPTPVDDQLTTREEHRYLVDADFWITG